MDHLAAPLPSTLILFEIKVNWSKMTYELHPVKFYLDTKGLVWRADYPDRTRYYGRSYKDRSLVHIKQIQRNYGYIYFNNPDDAKKDIVDRLTMAFKSKLERELKELAISC